MAASGEIEEVGWVYSVEETGATVNGMREFSMVLNSYLSPRDPISIRCNVVFLDIPVPSPRDELPFRLTNGYREVTIAGTRITNTPSVEWH